MSEVYVRDFSLCSPNVKVKPEADSGLRRGVQYIGCSHVGISSLK